PVNLIATPRWLSKRGPKGDLSTEYVAGEDSSGSAFGSALHDHDVHPDSLATPFGRDRWSTKGQHDWELPGDVRFKADYRFASDNAFPNDFHELASAKSDRYLSALASLDGGVGTSGRLGWIAGAEYYNDRQAPDNTDRDDFVLRRLPELDLHALPGPVGPFACLAPALDVGWARFDQEVEPQARYTDARLGTTNGRLFDICSDRVP